jgi:carbonic anhydrase
MQENIDLLVQIENEKNETKKLIAELEKTPTFAPGTTNNDPESPLLRMAKEEKNALLVQIDILRTEKEEKEKEIESHKIKLHKLEYSKSEEF